MPEYVSRPLRGMRDAVQFLIGFVDDERQGAEVNRIIDDLHTGIQAAEANISRNGGYDPTDDVAGALVLILQFDSRAYTRGSDLARDLVSAKKLAKQTLSRAGYPISIDVAPVETAAHDMLALLVDLERDLTSAGAIGQPLMRIRDMIKRAGV